MTEQRRPIASIRHTAILIAIFLAMAAYGVYLQRAAGSGKEIVGIRGSALPLYLALIAMEWGLLRYIVIGVKKTGTRLRDLVGPRWATPRDVLRDLAIALVVWGAWTGAEIACARALGPDTAKGISTLLPRGPLEAAVWIALSLSAGICEEAVFRGYLLKQFEGLSGSTAFAVAAQALVFGIAHGYQGLRNVITITALGLVYGAIAAWRRSLRPLMLLHAWMDVFGGLFAR